MLLFWIWTGVILFSLLSWGAAAYLSYLQTVTNTQIREHGRNTALEGKSVIFCPYYDHDSIVVWEEGWDKGHEQFLELNKEKQS